MKFKSLWIILSVVILIGTVYIFYNRRTNKMIYTKIGIIKVQSGLPTFVAYEQELFQKYGFTPELETFKTSDQTFDALKNGHIDVVGVSGLAQALKLNDVHPNSFYIIGILNSSPCLIVNNSSLINSIDSLKGKTIGVFPGSIFGKYVQETLKAAEVDISDITIIPISPPFQLNELKNGGVDALFTLEPTGLEGVSGGNCKYVSNENLFSKYLLGGNPFPGGIVAISKSFAVDHAKRVKDLIKLYEESLTIIQNENFNAVPYLDKFTSINPEVLKSIKYEGASFGKNMSSERLELFQNNINKWNLLKNEFDFKDLLYEE